jgi:hypothetical protein
MHMDRLQLLDKQRTMCTCCIQCSVCNHVQCTSLHCAMVARTFMFMN